MSEATIAIGCTVVFIVLVLVGALIALEEGTFTPRQTKGGLSWVEHAGMWLDLFFMPIAVYIMSPIAARNYQQYSSWLFFILLIALWFIFCWLHIIWGKQRPRAGEKKSGGVHVKYPGVILLSGFTHIVYMTIAGVLACGFYFAPHTALEAQQLWAVTAIISVTLYFGTLQPMYFFTEKWQWFAPPAVGGPALLIAISAFRTFVF